MPEGVRRPASVHKSGHGMMKRIGIADLIRFAGLAQLLVWPQVPKDPGGQLRCLMRVDLLLVRAAIWPRASGPLTFTG